MIATTVALGLATGTGPLVTPLAAEFEVSTGAVSVMFSGALCAMLGPARARGTDARGARSPGPVATMALNPLSEAVRDQLARARAGDLTGLRARDEHGDWATL